MCHYASEYDLPLHLDALQENWENNSHDVIFAKYPDITILKDNHRRSPIHTACEYGALSVLKLYKKYNTCDFNESDAYGYTPLLWCASTDAPECAFYLIKNGADPAAEDRKGRTTLYYAIENGLILLGKTVLQLGCWMTGTALENFVADMSLGQEKHKIVFDARSIEECREYYLTQSADGDCSEDANSHINELEHSDLISSKKKRKISKEADDYVTDIVVSRHYNIEKKTNGTSSSRASSGRLSMLASEVPEQETLEVESKKWSIRFEICKIYFYFYFSFSYY
jgi:hypothetical protein